MEEFNPIESSLKTMTESIESLKGYYMSPEILPMIKSYLKSELLKTLHVIIEIFHDEDGITLTRKNQEKLNKLLNNPNNFNRIIELENEKKYLPTPSREDISHFQEFFRSSCCSTLKCTNKINIQESLITFKNFLSLSKLQKDFYIYGQLSVFANLPKRKDAKSKFVYTYKVANKQCCRKFYQFSHNITSNYWLNKRIDNFEEGKLEEVDQRGGSFNTINFEVRGYLNTFIDNYLGKRQLFSPANGLIILPSTFTHKRMYEKYKEVGGTVSFSTMYNHFKTFWPSVRKQSPKNDYCSTCFIKQSLLRNTESLEEKEEIQESLDEHLEKSQDAREFYKVNIERAKVIELDTKNVMMSLDWAQNWELPRYQKQPGEIYFLQKQKVGLFGITDESIDAQVFYVFPEFELESYGKGANTTLSLLFHYFSNFKTNLRKIIIYADNCIGQNKNNYLLWFLHWIVNLDNVCQEIECNFLIKGHTKFSCDRHFGLAKLQYKKEDFIETYSEVLDIIKNSSQTNVVVPIRNPSTNQLNVDFYNW